MSESTLEQTSARPMASDRSGNSARPADGLEFLQGGGETGRLIRAKDWITSPLSSPDAWPQSLRTSVSTCLSCSFPILLWWGPDLVKIYNDAYASVIGGKHPFALGAKGKDVWPEIWDIIEPMLASAMGGQATPADDLLLMLERNGYPEECYFSFSYSPIRDESGGVGGVFCPVIETTNNVVGRRRLEQLRRLADETSDLHSVQDVLTAAADCLAHATPDFPFAALYATPDGAEGPAKLVATTNIPRVDLDGFDWPFEAARQSPVTVALDGPNWISTSEAFARPQHAVLQPLSHSAGFIVLGVTPHRPIEEMRQAARLVADQISSRIAGALATEADRARLSAVAERDRATATMLTAVNEALAANEARLRRNLQQMPGYAAILSGPDHVFQYVNDAYVKISGPRDFIGHTVREVFPELVGQGFYELLDRTYATGETFIANAMPILLAGEDEQRFIDLLYQPTRDERGAVGGIFVGGYDVTELVRSEAALRASEQAMRDLNSHLEARVAQEVQEKERALSRLVQAQRMEALGQLAGGIAHDFNNVLHAVAGGLNLILRKAADPEEVRKLANMAIGASERGAAITGRLLSFARRGELQPSAIAPRPLLEGLREILAPTLGAGIAINLEVADDAPLLLADKAQLETVLINLAINARDAMPAGGELTIRAVADMAHKGESESAGLRPGSYLRIELRDDGAGMDQATLKRASEPFFTTKPSGQGTGLGLAMARGFAEQSGGAFSISSKIGRGTTVTLWFPEADEANGTALTAKAEPAPGALHGRALVVDDDPMVRDILTQQLQAVGFQTVAASDGLDALSKIDAGLLVEVLVTDYSMPGMNGLALIEEVRRRKPRLPAVLLTGFADGAMRAKFEEENAEGSITALLRKPVDEHELAGRLAAVLLSSPEGAS